MSFIPEKMNSIERALVAAASMAPSDARNVLRLICEGGMTTTVALNEPSEGDKHYAKREKFIKRMKSSTDRVCDYARHETLRNIEKHFRDNPQHINAADEESKPSLAARLTFDRSSFSEELLAALAEDQAAALKTSGQQLFDEIGKDSVWRLPSQDALQFIEDRANLLANVPEEVHANVMAVIQDGLEHGDSRKDLMGRISTVFDVISKSRAETIANTETAAAFNYARDKAMHEAGVTHKRWLHSQSPLIKEPRPTHVEADGQIQSIDDPFNVGGVQFMRPADDSLGAGPEDIINCHCVAIPVEAPIESGEGEGHPFRGNQYKKFGTSGEPSTLDEAMNTKTGAEWVRDHRFEFMANYMQHQTRKKADLDLVGGYMVRRGSSGWDIIDSNGATLIKNTTPEKLYDYARRGTLGYLTKKADDLRIDIVQYHKL